MSRVTLHGWVEPALLAILAIAARIGAQAVSGFYAAPETWEEGEIALRLVGGLGYSFEINGTTAYALRGPTYPILLAFAYAVLGASPAVAGAVQAALGGLLAASGYALAHGWAGVGPARLSGVALALYPPLIVYAAKVHQLNLDAPVVVLTALMLATQLPTRSKTGAACYGALAALATLSRATFGPFFAVTTVLLLAPLHGSRMRVLVPIILAAAIVVVPWVVRNQLELGQPIITTTTGYLLWIGNNPHATGSTVTGDGTGQLDASPGLRERIWGLDEREQDRIFMSAALSHMAADPARTLADYAGKLGAFWWLGPTAGSAYPRAWLVLYAAQYVAVLALAAIGGWWAWRHGDRWTLVVVLCALVTVSLMQSVFYVDGRHRWAVEPLLVILAAIGLLRGAPLLVRR